MQTMDLKHDIIGKICYHCELCIDGKKAKVRPKGGHDLEWKTLYIAEYYSGFKVKTFHKSNSDILVIYCITRNKVWVIPAVNISEINKLSLESNKSKYNVFMVNMDHISDAVLRLCRDKDLHTSDFKRKDQPVNIDYNAVKNTIELQWFQLNMWDTQL
jgi:hypothetical protein